MAALTFRGEGFKAFGLVLERYQQRLDDLSPVWEQLADRFIKLQAQNFASQGATMSGGWSPLSPQYARQKARSHPGAPILVRDGDLRDSLAGTLGIREHNRHSMTVGTAVPYATYHQNGTPRMPARRLIGDVPVGEQREWGRILQRFIVEGY